MQLKEYLFRKNMKISEFAAKIGERHHKVYWVIRGGNPTLGVAKKIIEETNGQVTLDDLLHESTPPW